jgi:anti-sigma factor RsiW
MNSCKTIDPLVTPYIDGELPDADRHLIDDHLRVCPPCYSRVAAERTVRELIRANQNALKDPAAPTSLRAACAEIARVKARAPRVTDDARGVADRVGDTSNGARSIGDGARGVSRAPASSWRARVTPYALAASLVIVVGGAFVYQATDRSVRLMAAELAADHVKCFALNHALGTHQTGSAVEASMGSSFGWTMHLPMDASRAGLELVGARPCLYGGGKIAHIMYRHQGRPVSLFMLPKTARAQELVEVLGHEAAIWCVGNRTFVLIAREPRQEVEQLASFVQAGLQ